MNKHLKAALAAAAGLVLATQASATVYHLTYKGIVGIAADQTGEFGAGASLVGKSFIAHVTFDDAKPGAAYTTDPGGEWYYGYGAANPLAVDVLLNGVHRSFGATYGQDFRYDYTLDPACTFDCTRAGFNQEAEDRYNVGGHYTLNYINLNGETDDGTISGIAHTPPLFTNPPVDLTAWVSISEIGERGQVFHKAEVGVKIDSVTEGVPEPGTWALMVGGFGFTGTMLRRRRAALAFA